MTAFPGSPVHVPQPDAPKIEIRPPGTSIAAHRPNRCHWTLSRRPGAHRVQSRDRKRTGSVLAAADLDELLDVGDLGRHGGREFVRIGTVSEGVVVVVLSSERISGQFARLAVWGRAR